MAAREVDRATWNEETFVNEMENAAREASGKIRAKIERAVFFDAAREINAGIFFSGGELDVRIGFIVAKHDIELRTVLLDEIVLKSESFALVADKDGFEVGDLSGERACLGVHPA